jgi:CHAD domain-containing protein
VAKEKIGSRTSRNNAATKGAGQGKRECREETQLTFLLSPKQLTTVESSAFFRDPAMVFVETRKFTVTHYDGESRPLGEKDLSLRVEGSGGRFRQHLSLPLKDIGAAKHAQNWVYPLPSDTPVLSSLAEEIERELLQACSDDGLVPVLRRKIEANVYRLVSDTGSEIRVEVVTARSTADKKTVTDSELTLSLEKGSKQDLFESALRLHNEIQLKLAPADMTGYARIFRPGGHAVSRKANKMSLISDATVEDAVAHVVQHCLSHLRANDACVLESEAPEGVHQLRVSLRRLRSALRIFRPVLPPAHYRWLNGESRHFAGRMGDLRNLDVFLHEIVEPPEEHFPDKAIFDNLRAQIAAGREKSRHAARDALLEKRYTDYILNLSAWLARRGWREQPVSKKSAQLFSPIEPFAVTTLDKVHGDVMAAGRRFAELSVPQRHDMRIKVKRLRYASDFFSSLFPKKAVANYNGHLADLQESLGYLNDVAVAEELVDQICDGLGSKDALACRAAGGVVIGWHSHAMAVTEDRLLRSVREFVATNPYWKGREK